MSLTKELYESWGKDTEKMCKEFFNFTTSRYNMLEKRKEEILEKMKEELKVGNFGKASDYFQNYATCDRSIEILRNFIEFTGIYIQKNG